MGVTSVLPLLIGIAGTALSEKTPASGHSHLAVRILTPMLWLGAIIAMCLYWSYFNNWQATHHEINSNIDPMAIASITLLHILSGGFAVAVAADKLSATEAESEVI